MSTAAQDKAMDRIRALLSPEENEDLTKNGACWMKRTIGHDNFDYAPVPAALLIVPTASCCLLLPRCVYDFWQVCLYTGCYEPTCGRPFDSLNDYPRGDWMLMLALYFADDKPGSRFMPNRFKKSEITREGNCLPLKMYDQLWTHARAYMPISGSFPPLPPREYFMNQEMLGAIRPFKDIKDRM